MTPEEASFIGHGNIEADNNLSSIKLIRNSKGYGWEIKIKHEDPTKIIDIVVKIDEELRRRYA